MRIRAPLQQRPAVAAIKPVKPGHEVTVDYNQVGDAVGDGDLTWGGKTVPSYDRTAKEFFERES